MKAPTAIIAEDEPLLREELRELLKSAWPDLQICFEASDGQEAVRAFDRLRPEILFLDIQMPGMTGLEVAEHVGRLAHVVFISAFNRFAVDAFERGALDYVLKPLSYSRLRLTVERLRERLSGPPADLGGIVEILRTLRVPEQRFLKWITVPHRSKLRLVTVAEILYLQADNKYTTLVTQSDRYLLNSSLKELRQKLEPEIFWQIHRGTVANVGAIDTIYRSFKGTLEIKVKGREELLPVSSANAHLFRQL